MCRDYSTQGDSCLIIFDYYEVLLLKCTLLSVVVVFSNTTIW